MLQHPASAVGFVDEQTSYHTRSGPPYVLQMYPLTAAKNSTARPAAGLTRVPPI